MEVGAEVFVSIRIHRNNPLHWKFANVIKVTKRFIYVGYPRIRDKRIPKDKIIDGALVDEGLIVWFPSNKDRSNFESAQIRFELESKIHKIRWGNLSNDTLQKIIDLSQSDLLDQQIHRGNDQRGRIISEACDRSVLRTLGAYEVPFLELLESEARYHSLIGNALCKVFPTHPFSWCITPDGGNHLRSARNLSNFDVSAVAREFGGDGHHNAAGFQPQRDSTAQ